MEKLDLRFVKDPAQLDRRSWAEFVHNHPNGNVFQTPQMYEVFEQSKAFTPVLIAVVDDQEIKGLLLAVIQQEMKGIAGIFSKRAVIRGGPLIDNQNKEILELILHEFNRIVKKKVLYTQVRNWTETPTHFKSIFKKYGFKYIDHLNILVDLTQSQEDLWKRINTGKKRGIKKAYKEKVQIELEGSETGLENTYNILEEVYNRVKLPYPEIEFFKALQNLVCDEPRFLIFSAKWENKIIAFRYVLAFKKVLYISYAGALKEYYPKCANDLMNWEVFLWGKQNGYTVYDFAGAGSPHVAYGVRNNKLRFGGELCSPGRYEKAHQPLLLFFAKKAFYLWQKLSFR